MSLSRLQKKILALVTCFLSDLTLVTWLYFKATNYNNYGTIAAKTINSPDFQIQLYRILLQSLTFFLLVFFIAQTIVYVLAAKNFRAAFLYLKFFAVFGFAFFLMISLTASLFGLMPMTLYLFGYYTFAKLFKEASAIVQTTPPPTTLEPKIS